MQRTGGKAVNEAGVAPKRVVRRHSWFHRKPGSSRVSGDGRLQAMLSKLEFLVDSVASRSRVAVA